MATKGTVLGVIANMVTLTVDGPVAQNEICYITTPRSYSFTSSDIV